jgi:polyisoprenoid-binding protein YceI
MTLLPDRSVRRPLLLLALLLPPRAGAEPRTFVLDPERSQVQVHVGRAGLFKFAGHEHEVEAPLFRGEIVAEAADLGRSTVRLEFETARVRVTGRGEPPADVPKVQEAMWGERVLDAARFPIVRFHSTKVEGRETAPGVYALVVSGPLQIRGRDVPLSFSVTADTRQGLMVVTGRGRIKQSAFGIEPLSVGGVVKVKDELQLEFHFEGAPPP